DAHFMQELKEGGLVPRSVAHLDDERIILETARETLQVGEIVGRLMERKRKLKQDRAEFSGVAQHVESGAGVTLFFGARVSVMSESLPKLGRDSLITLTRAPKKSVTPAPDSTCCATPENSARSCFNFLFLSIRRPTISPT